jgi:hypothetical protein
MKSNEALIAILKKSHSQAMAGETMSMDEIKTFMKNKVNELTNQVDVYSVAESI